jgi:hypothetical protein
LASYVERRLASQDKRFQAALAEANSLLGMHEASRGAEYEDDVRSLIARFLPYTHQIHDGFMRPVDGLKKQLDVVIRSRFLPELLREVPVDLITVAGEVKTTLSNDGKDDYIATAAKLATAGALAGRRKPMPFFALAGALKRSTDHASWLASVVSDASAATAGTLELWPAAFSFDEEGPISAVSVGPSAPLTAATAAGEELSGVISIAADQLTPSAVCYLWLWACLYSGDDARGMELRYMRECGPPRVGLSKRPRCVVPTPREGRRHATCDSVPAVHRCRRRENHRAALWVSGFVRWRWLKQEASGSIRGRAADRGDGPSPFHAHHAGLMGGGA